jgi:hypothetical protein
MAVPALSNLVDGRPAIEDFKIGFKRDALLGEGEFIPGLSSTQRATVAILLF